VDPRVAAVLVLIETRSDFDTVALASSVNLSPSRLRHLFRADMSISIHRFLRERRLQRAKDLLKTTFLSVKQVTTASGFHDTCHFVREFHKIFGVSPGAYRRTAISDNR